MSIISENEEKIFLQEEVFISISPTTRVQMFEGYSLISDAEQDKVMSATYTKEELKTIQKNGIEFYGEDDTTNAINDEFHRMLKDGGRYEF